MKVKLTDVKAITDRLFEHLANTGQEEFEITDDYYWEISKDQLYDPSSDPTDLAFGQLSHDWERLQAILKEEDPPVGYACVWLSSILRSLGEKSAY